MASALPKHELALRIWIGIVAFMALGNTFACFFGNPAFLQQKLYNAKPKELTPLAARLFGCWTLLSCIVRSYCSVYLRNKVLYHITLITFVVAFMHFISELFSYNSCLLDVGVAAPLAVSGMSMIWMFVAQWFIEFDQIYPPRSASSQPRSSKSGSKSDRKTK